MADSEPELVGRVRRGDQQAFAELAQANRGPAWAVCLRITGSVHDAEDALQDALAAAWQNIHRSRGDSKFSTWFFRIAANAALAVVRRRAEVTEEAETIASSQSSVEELVTNADRVQSALLQLPEVFRVALVLRVYGDLTYEDIARHQGIPIQTVKSRISRARTMMETLLADDARTDRVRP